MFLFLKVFCNGKKEMSYEDEPRTDFILVSNMRPWAAPLDGSCCILTSFKQIVHSILEEK